jgi:hypothetical protein
LLKRSILPEGLEDSFMKIAIMQPYIFPYIGYFQLIHAVDKFVIYDDVSFIKQGWINRNRILSNDSELLFSIPLEQISSYRRICETKINGSSYARWHSKFLRTIEQSYKKAPNFMVVYPMIRSVFSGEYEFIHQLCIESIITVTNYLEIDTEIIMTSRRYNNSYLRAQDRVIDICMKENASIYINLFGGISLYNQYDFRTANLHLLFLKSRPATYLQLRTDFVPRLSIIDVMMFNKPQVIRRMLDEYELL